VEACSFNLLPLILLYGGVGEYAIYSFEVRVQYMRR